MINSWVTETLDKYGEQYVRRTLAAGGFGPEDLETVHAWLAELEQTANARANARIYRVAWWSAIFGFVGVVTGLVSLALGFFGRR